MTRVMPGTKVKLMKGIVIIHSGFPKKEPCRLVTKIETLNRQREAVVEFHWSLTGVIDIRCNCALTRTGHLSRCKVRQHDVLIAT